MFEATKNSMKRNKQLKQFAFLIAAATVVPEGATAPIGYGLLPEKDANELVAAEPTLVTINPSVPANAEGNLQVAVTPAGLASAQLNAATAVAQVAAPVAQAQASTAKFEILKGVACPPIQRGGGTRTSKYPFAQLEIGDAFDVESTPKAFASTISGQNKKYSKTNPVRKFTLRTIKAGVDGAKFDGSRVWRIAVAETPAA